MCGEHGAVSGRGGTTSGTESSKGMDLEAEREVESTSGRVSGPVGSCLFVLEVESSTEVSTETILLQRARRGLSTLEA